MGSIYKNKYRDRKTGEIRESAVWWIAYYRGGVKMRESTETDKLTKAKEVLRRREGDIVRGVPVSPRANRITLGELLDNVLTDYQENGKKSYQDAEGRIRLHLRPFFGHRRAGSVTTADVRRYVTIRRAETDSRGLNRKVKEGEEEKPREERHPSNGQINRELTLLKRAYSLGVKDGLLYARPHIPMLAEDNVRTGFFDREQFEQVKAKLPEYLQPFALFGFITGWRKEEITGLEWRNVDFNQKRVRLETGTTKNKKGREFPITGELDSLLRAQWAEHEALKKTGRLVARVFHRDGDPIGDFRKAWSTACEKAGFPGRIFHDLRRSAVRSLVRANIPQSVAMKMTGHQTDSVFRRYDIVDEADLNVAAELLEQANSVTGKVSGKVNG